MTPKFSASSSPYSQRSPLQADKKLFERTLDQANNLKNDVLRNYNHLENKVNQALKVEANDHSWLAYGKRYAASQIGTHKGAVLWAEETVTGTLSLVKGTLKTAGTTQIQNLDNLSFGMLSKVAPNLVKESRAHNTEVAQTTLNISKTVLNYSKDATLDNLNKYSFGSLGKHFETINQASQRQQERAEQIYNWGTTQLKEGKQAYLTADSNAQAKQAKVVIDIATVVVPFTKASTLNKGLKVADGLADLSKLETSTVKLTQNAFNKTITDLNYARKAEGGVELSFNMKVAPPKSAYAQQPQLNVPTQITPKVTIHPLEQPTPIGKIKAAEHTLVEISKDALNKGEMVLKQGKELELSMPVKPRDRGLTPMEDPNLQLKNAVKEVRQTIIDKEESILKRVDKNITYSKEPPSHQSFKEVHFKDALQEAGLTEKEFQRLNLTPIEKYTPYQIEQMKLVRERVPALTQDTELQKVITLEHVENYLSGKWEPKIGGYIARAEDVKHLKAYDEVRESLRLDYMNTPYKEGLNEYGVIRFRTAYPENAQIPYGKIFGGDNTSPAPATRNGFLSSRNGDVIPEWEIPRDLSKTPKDGAELYKIVHGKEELVGRFIELEDGDGYFMKIPKKGN